MKTAHFFLALILFATSYRGVAQYYLYDPAQVSVDWNGNLIWGDPIGEAHFDSVSIRMDISDLSVVSFYEFYVSTELYDGQIGSDSLEMHGFFQLHQHDGVSGLNMWIGDTLRIGRLLDEKNAQNIYINTVHPDNLVPMDPAWLQKEGTSHELTVFPVEQGGQRLIQMEVTTVLEKQGDDEAAFRLPLDMFNSGLSEDNKIYFSYELHGEVERVDFDDPSLQTWNIGPQGERWTLVESIGALESINGTVTNEKPAEVRSAHYAGDEGHYNVFSLNMGDVMPAQRSCDYVIAIDIDIAKFDRTDAEEQLRGDLASIANHLITVLTENDRFKLFVNEGIADFYKEEWLSATPQNIMAAMGFAQGFELNYAHAFKAASSALHAFEEDEMGQVLLVSNDRFFNTDSDILIQQAYLEQLEDMRPEIRVDFMNPGANPGSNVVRYSNQTLHQSFDFMNTLCEARAGMNWKSDWWFENDYESNLPNLRPTISHADVQAGGTSYSPLLKYHEFIEEDGRSLLLFTAETSTPIGFFPDLFQVSLSNGESFSYENLEHSSYDDPAMAAIYGMVRSEILESQGAQDNVISANSVKYQFLHDFTSWLVVEHDSMYNDTVWESGGGWFPLGAEEAENTSESQVSVFPNPAQQTLNIESPDAEIEHVQIYDLNGRLVQNLSGLTGTRVSLDVSELQSGLYMISVQTSDGAWHRQPLKVVR